MPRRWLAVAGQLHRRLSSSSSPSSSSGVAAVKRVTRSNFASAVEELRPLVEACKFVAVDLEMTGVTSAPWREAFEFDCPHVRYLKLRDSATNFAVLQFGVCPFIWDPLRSSLLAHPHNFYIFPREEIPFCGPLNEFLCQTTSMDFLSRHQFDFNACIYEGISYLSRAQENEARHTLYAAFESELNEFNNSEHMEIPTASTSDLLFTERMKIRLYEWQNLMLKSSSTICSSEEAGDCSKINFQTIFYKLRPAIRLNGFSSRQVNLVRRVVKKHFKGLVYVQSNDENILVYTDSLKDRLTLMKEVRNDLEDSAEAKIKDAVGFRHVIDLLVSQKKLIVGHNCFLDMAHIHDKFFGQLPSTVAEFVSSLHASFPHIIDTKYLLNASHALQFIMKKSSKSLSSAFSLLCPKVCATSRPSYSQSHVTIEVPEHEQGSTYWNSGAIHEAGYDAFMTGCVFAQACNSLGIKFEATPTFDLAGHESLKNFINLLHPSWNSGTLIDLRSGVESPDSSYKRKYPAIVFENIVLLWGFPFGITQTDIKKCIGKVFGQDSLTSVFFVDQTTAFLQFRKAEYVHSFLILKDTLEKNDSPISVLHPFAKLLDGGKTCAASYDAYRDICGASVSRVLFADQANAVGIKWRTKLDQRYLEQAQVNADDCEISAKDTACATKYMMTADKCSITTEQANDVCCDDILDSFYSSKYVFGK